MAAAIPELLGLTLGESIAAAAGFAVAPAVRPWVQDFANEAWKLHTVRPLDIGHAAEIAAQYRVFEDRARSEGEKQGIDPALMDNLILAMREAPALEALFALWRRGLVDEATVDFGLAKLKIAERFRGPLKETKNLLLSPADLAMMRQQGFIDRARQVDESAKQGVDAERADLLFEISGLPPPTERAMEMLRRGIIDEPTFRQIVREGHEKTKYTDEELALRHPVLSATEAATLRLKGWITAAESYALGALTGYSQEERERIFLAMGRPAAPVQMFTGWARGIDGPDGVPMNKAQFLKGIRESDIRPEWGEMLWGIRHAYPSLFQLRRAVQDGGISRARALTILRYERYEDTDAVALVDSWLTGTGTTAKGLTVTDLANEYEALWITRAQYVSGLQQLGYSADNAAAKADAEDARRARRGRDALVARIHSLYVSHRLSRTATLDALGKASVPARVRDSLMPDWDVERDITADALTAAQIKKAFKKALMTRVEAIDRLEAKGYDAPDAGIYLDQ